MTAKKVTKPASTDIVGGTLHRGEKTEPVSSDYTFIACGLVAWSRRANSSEAHIGMLMVVYTVIHKLVNPNVAIGYSSLMSIILFIGGMIMFMLGLIGEYIGRIYISLNNSPQFVIRDTINLDD